jgi:hypothetical protein
MKITTAFTVMEQINAEALPTASARKIWSFVMKL